MFVVIVKFEVKQEHAESFKTLVLKQAKNSLGRETKCHQFDVITDNNSSNVFYLYETYTHRSAFDEHLSSSHFLEFDSLSKGLVITKEVFLGERC